LDLSQTLSVTEDIFEEFTRRHVPQQGDIVFSRVGTYGNASYVATDAPFCLGQNTALIHPKINGRFLHLYLQSSPSREQIEQSVVGPTQKTISLKSIGALQVPVPPKQELQAIAHIVGTLDDKIELNQRMNETLEAMALALFKSWFVDFDPVRAKAEGRDPGLPQPSSISSPTALKTLSWARFRRDGRSRSLVTWSNSLTAKRLRKPIGEMAPFRCSARTDRSDGTTRSSSPDRASLLDERGIRAW